MTRLRATRYGGQEGFTLVELLVAMVIVLLIAGALVHTAPMAHDAFDRLPSVLEMQRRGNAAIDTLSQALRAADRITPALPDDDGVYGQLTVVMPIANPAQGVLAVDQAGAFGSMSLAAWPCPNVKEVCGFTNGATALVTDGAAFDVFIVTSANAALRRLSPNHVLSRAYLAGSMLLEVEEHTFGLDQQADGTSALARVTAAGAVQPIVDGVRSLSFRVDGRRVDVEVVVHAQTEALQQVIADRVFKSSITVRNGHVE